MGRLTTHVLDTARGVPAEGVTVDLHLLAANGRTAVASAITNGNGRTDAALLDGDRLVAGIYELTFHVGDYFQRAGVVLSEPPLFGDVVIRIGIADPAAHLHVPLLVSPYGYSTYRGS